jgi:hypothetical protein
MKIDPKKIARMISEDPDEVNPFDDTEDEFTSDSVCTLCDEDVGPIDDTQRTGTAPCAGCGRNICASCEVEAELCPTCFFHLNEFYRINPETDGPMHNELNFDDTEALLRRAEEIARSAHEGQLYGDVPYINHPLAVKARVGNNLMAQVAAILHDVLEDTPTSSQDLLDAGMPPASVTAVEAITRSAGEKYFAYITRLSNNSIARIVKVADLEENLSNLPEGHSLESRYLKALDMLTK